MKMIRQCRVLIALISVSTASGTTQYPERILQAGVAHPLETHPLEICFRAHPEKRPSSGNSSSALWRGYVGHFEIIDGWLWVTDIRVQGRYPFQWRSVLAEVFPERGERRLDWFTGILVMPLATEAQSAPHAYRLAAVKKGRVVANRVFTPHEHKEYLELQRDAYKKSGADERAKADSDPICLLHLGPMMEALVDYEDFRPNQPPQRDAGSRPSSDDAQASETPSSLGPRG